MSQCTTPSITSKPTYRISMLVKYLLLSCRLECLSFVTVPDIPNLYQNTPVFRTVQNGPILYSTVFTVGMGETACNSEALDKVSIVRSRWEKGRRTFDLPFLLTLVCVSVFVRVSAMVACHWGQTWACCRRSVGTGRQSGRSEAAPEKRSPLR